MAKLYEFVAYDVLQSQNGPNGEWLDFMTLRTEGEASDACALVARGTFNGNRLPFRIVRRDKVVYSVEMHNEHLARLDKLGAFFEAHPNLTRMLDESIEAKADEAKADEAKPLTYSSARAMLRSEGVTLRRLDGEYRVTLKGQGEASAYYTNDLGDAVNTARAMLRTAATPTDASDDAPQHFTRVQTTDDKVVVRMEVNTLGGSALSLSYADGSASVAILDPTISELDALIHNLQAFRSQVGRATIHF